MAKKKPLPAVQRGRMHVPVTVSERLHWLVKRKLISRPRVIIRGEDGSVTNRKVTMHRFLEWLVVSALESKGFDCIDKIAREERVPLRHAVGMVYAFAALKHEGFRSFLRRNRPKSVDEIPMLPTSSKSPDEVSA